MYPVSAPTPLTVIPLIDWTLLRVSGNDASDFLQSQTSNDIRQLTSQAFQLNSYCSAKGRMYAIFWVLKQADDYLLLLPTSVSELFLKRLRMFVMRAAVKIELLTDQSVLAISEPTLDASSSSILATLAPVGALPEPSQLTTTAAGLLLQIPTAPTQGRHFLLIGAQASIATACHDLLQHGAQLAAAEVWRLRLIEAGVPMIYAETVEHFVPQMANLQLINGVNFKKGCYPGQEIVARMQYLGSLKRRMYYFEATLTNNAALPLPGSAIVAVGNERSHEAGEVVDAQYLDDQHIAGLAVLNIERAEQQLRLHDLSGADLSVSAPHYGLTPITP
ncbi:MAG: folate-binding protein YgfZ [Gammaproteobacteria bacterium]|nr:folate-binding protein YgfZ [Gammaproteobacteria bacterium]